MAESEIKDHNLVIMAAGLSSRMSRSSPATHSLNGPKSMIPVGSAGRPFLDYLLDNAVEAGYRDIVIVVAAEDTMIRNRYSQSRRISFAEQIIPEGRIKPAGTADALLCALKQRPDWSGGKFTVCNSDNLYSSKALRLMLLSPHGNSLIAYNKKGLDLPDRKIAAFALLHLDADSRVLGIIEKPERGLFTKLVNDNPDPGVSMNIFRFDYDMIIPILEEVPIDPVRDEKEMATAVRVLIDRHPGSLRAVRLCEPVPDLTAWEDIEKMNEFIRDNYPDH